MKTLQKTIAAVALATLLFSSNVFAQSSASAVADISISLIKGLSISQVGGSLTFDEVVLTSSTQTPSISNVEGAHFEVVGHPNRDVTITYNDATLTNTSAWNNNETLTFLATMDQSGSSTTHAVNSVSTGGATLPLVNETGIGKLNLWLGGSISILSTQVHGVYEGSISVAVVY